MFLSGMLPMIVLKAVILNSYEKRAVDVRTADIQNQCTILCNQLGDLYGQEGDTSDIVRTQLVQLSNIYNGRVMIIDHEFRIIEDTYGMDVGKTIVSGNVIRCFSGEGTSRYDAGNRYIEVTSPIVGKASEMTEGVMLVSVSTDTIIDSLLVLEKRARTIEVVTGLILLIFAVVTGAGAVRPFRRITSSIEAVTEG